MMHQHLSAVPMVTVPASQVVTQVMAGPSQSPQPQPARTPNRDFLAAVDDMSPLPNYAPPTPGSFLPIQHAPPTPGSFLPTQHAPSPSPGLQTPKTTPVKQSPDKQQEHDLEQHPPQ